jgi:hypothetical protein
MQSGCTTGCTTKSKKANADPLETLAEVLRSLSAADRARLAAMVEQAPVRDNKPAQTTASAAESHSLRDTR